MHNQNRNEAKQRGVVYFLRNEQPSVRRALPPVGWQRTVEQPAQMTTVCACEKTVVMVKQPGHLTSIKKDRGAGTRFCKGAKVNICNPKYVALEMMCNSYLELVLASLSGRSWVEEINRENLYSHHHVSGRYSIRPISISDQPRSS